ncbi:MULTISPECIES: FxSxx-COOH cyclophane-containing RiPP peptide [unclassified Pseudofrankia]|uniref:FxSxx-COOH cyclophane-containing RiPP peptide n=1 Tax=unclassified Pseudofrankia TaxID=2994372 RepID=UPI0008D906BA|nr:MULTISPECIES: FxSxx-COOH cyclophane-containing RiPP peptide [unclassified Pseudofrankia]MDT3444366.1 FxSxx-COOH cyclophane-containing RiPP peptide [Pseudofrankia sp. BMG5.37]OHV56506.1 FXSXX-COOH protein [Pseudofrankia sp. BMG5.36]
MNESPPEIVTDLVDLTKVDFERLSSTISEQAGESAPDSALAHSLRRILQEARDPASAIAGFKSSI